MTNPPDPKGPDPCLTDAEILAWLERSLPEDRRSDVASHLDDCRLCGAAVEGVAGLESKESFLASTHSLRARVRDRTATALKAFSAARRPAPRFRLAPRYLALAATLVLGIGAAFVLTRPAPGERLFLRYFEPYPSTLPLVRGANGRQATPGSAAADGRSNALALYEARDYRGALALLDDRLQREPNDPLVLFYAGLSRLALGRSRQAVGDLEQARRLAESDLREPAEWYLALAQLRGDDPAAAHASLERIAAAGGFYQDKARALLSDLDRPHRGN